MKLTGKVRMRSAKNPADWERDEKDEEEEEEEFNLVGGRSC